jgi:outer membrane protein OmpA-like peptidoglycan-associated protein
MFVHISDNHFHPLQIFFSRQKYLAHYTNYHDSVPQFVINQENLSDNQNIEPYKWLEFQTKIITNEDENYFVIGNFNKGETDEYTGHHRYSGNGGMYYLLDDISLTASDSVAEKNYSENLSNIYHQDFRHSYWFENDLIEEPKIRIDSMVYFTQKIDTLILPEVLFDIDSFVLKNEFTNVMDSFCNQISIQEFTSISIIGHTDNTGTESHNIELSMSRAHSVVEYITSKINMPIEKIKFDGKGSSEPKASNDDKDGRSKNRRVEILIYRN